MNAGTIRMPRATPESVGVSSQSILDLLKKISDQGPNQELHSIMILRHGKVIAEGWWKPYTSELPHLLYSLSKSFTSTAVGLAASENLLNLSDPVISFFPDDLPSEIAPYLAELQIRHLLTMTVGQATEPWPISTERSLEIGFPDF